MKSFARFWKESQRNKIVIVATFVLGYLILYSLISPTYPESYFQKRSQVSTVAPTRAPKAVPTIDFERYENPDAKDYFKDLAYEVAGMTAESEVKVNEDKSLEVFVTISVIQIGKKSDLMVFVRRWVWAFVTEAFLSPYEVKRVLVTVRLNNNAEDNVVVSVGKNQISKLEEEALRNLSPFEFCDWVLKNVTKEQNDPANMTSYENFTCS